MIIRGARLGQQSLLEALAAGCIPVIAADSLVMPFQDVIDWKRFVIYYVMNQALSDCCGLQCFFSPGHPLLSLKVISLALLSDLQVCQMPGKKSSSSKEPGCIIGTLNPSKRLL